MRQGRKVGVCPTRALLRRMDDPYSYGAAAACLRAAHARQMLTADDARRKIVRRFFRPAWRHNNADSPRSQVTAAGVLELVAIDCNPAPGALIPGPVLKQPCRPCIAAAGVH